MKNTIVERTCNNLEKFSQFRLIDKVKQNRFAEINFQAKFFIINEPFFDMAEPERIVKVKSSLDKFTHQVYEISFGKYLLEILNKKMKLLKKYHLSRIDSFRVWEFDSVKYLCVLFKNNNMLVLDFKDKTKIENIFNDFNEIINQVNQNLISQDYLEVITKLNALKDCQAIYDFYQKTKIYLEIPKFIVNDFDEEFFDDASIYNLSFIEKKII